MDGRPRYATPRGAGRERRLFLSDRAMCRAVAGIQPYKAPWTTPGCSIPIPRAYAQQRPRHVPSFLRPCQQRNRRWTGVKSPEHGFIHHRASARVLRIAGREAWHAQLIAPREPDIERLNRPGNRFAGIPQESQTHSPHPRYRCSLRKDQLHLRNAPGTSLLRRLAHFNPMSCFQRSA